MVVYELRLGHMHEMCVWNSHVTRIYIMYQKTVEISTGIIWIHSLGFVHNDEHGKLGHAQKDKVKKKGCILLCKFFVALE